MYRTGDVARWLPDGAVEYLGRSDDQLKIRGQRIELSEIDHALLSLPGVRQAVTHALVLQGTPVDAGGDARQLVGYLVMQPGASWDAEALRAALADRLPPHMVPVALVEMSDLPLSANGKLDRKALPQPQGGERKAGRRRRPGWKARSRRYLPVCCSVSRCSPMTISSRSAAIRCWRCGWRRSCAAIWARRCPSAR